MVKWYFIVICSCLILHCVAEKSRIIGGINAISGQFPFVAAVEVSTSNSRHFCAATLINSQWLITAAQCAYNATLFTIRIGTTSLTKEDPNEINVATSEYVIHPKYNSLTLQNDIALIRLRMPIQFSNYILPIHSLASETLEDYTRIVILGWGQTSDTNSSLSENLKFVVVTSLSNEECKLTYGNQITDEMVCVEGSYDEGSCNGDTGGALVRVIAMGNAELVGIASFVSGNGCESTDPSGYTRLYPYIDWIQTIIQ